MAKDMKRTYRHFTLGERKFIEKSYKKLTPTEIGYLIDKDPASIYRELSRCEDGKYTAKKAQEDWREKTQHKYYFSRCKVPVSSSERKQIEMCIRMQPTIDEKSVIQITNIDPRVVKAHFGMIRKQVMTDTSRG